MYQCVAENKHGIIYSTAQLMVLGKIGYLPLLSSYLSVCVWSSPEIKTWSILQLSAISLQTHLMSLWTLPSKILMWWSVSFCFHSFHPIDLDTTNVLLCGIVHAFSCRLGIDLFAKLWWLPSDWLNVKLDSVVIHVKIFEGVPMIVDKMW